MMRALLLLTFPLAAWAQPRYDFAEVDRILTEASGRVRTGLSLVLTQHGQVIYDRSLGPIDPSQPIAIASASKWLSGATLLALVDEGRLSLDDTFAQSIPAYRAGKSGITLRQAFSHTSGFPAETALQPETPCIANRSTTLEACADEIARVPLATSPGTALAYGSLSMQVTGRVMEIAASKPFVDIFREKITGSLGMLRTVAGLPGQDRNPLLAGGFASTAADYTRFLNMILQGGTWDGRRVLSPRAIHELERDQTNGVPIVSSPYQNYEALQPGIGQTRYGIGNWLERIDGGLVREASSQGGFGFSPWIDRDRNLAGVLMVRDTLPTVQPFYVRLKAAIARAIPPSPFTSLGVVNAASYQGGFVAPGEWVSLFGTFAGAGADTQVLVDGEAAELLFAGPNQITARIPLRTAGQVSVRIEVRASPSQPLPAVIVPVEPAKPGLFSADASGRGLAAALNEDLSVNSRERPAAAGSIVVLFGTGLGAELPNVNIGGRRAAILYAGPSPSARAGFFQINARIPLNTPSGEQPVVVDAAGFRSQENVHLAIR